MLNPPVRKLVLLLVICLILLPAASMATHQRAAEITYKHLSGLTYEITLTSYTFTPSPANAFRDYLTIDWGDGAISEIPRVQVTNLPNEITYNRYVGQHTYPGPAVYEISCEDPNRNGGIMNIPNSINTPLFIYSQLTISPFIGGYNDSPVLLMPPVDNGCVNQPFYHNPGAYDADGDSLSYRLVPCRGALGQIIPGYTYPPATNKLSLDSVTGDLIWDSPPQQGEYNIAILIEEWRNGLLIGSVLRDMQIIVIACNNHPPVIDSVADTCVEAGKILRFGVRAWDPDTLNTVTLTGTGGPLIIADNPATLTPNPAIGTGITRAVFRWATTCSHVKKHPYQVFFKAKDDGQPVSLVSFRSIKILVIGPAPENLAAVPFGNSITLTWDNYACANAKGYNIYRKADSTGYIPDYCQTGVPGYLGYHKIDAVNDISQTTYFDDNKGAGLVRGLKYCYLVVAVYPDGAEGYASNEACASLNKDVAVITNVSVNNTDVATGSLFVAWSKPTELDTIQAPGPYKYLIARARTDGQFVLADSLSNLNDTLFTDTLLNTAQYGFRYRIDLYNNTPGNRFLIGSSQVASSMFLTITPTDKQLNLLWTNDVPWTNQRFVIYRKELSGTLFDSVGSSLQPAFINTGLKNGQQYCYFVRSVGKYSAAGFVDPIINLSQKTCAVPADNIPPCPPQLAVTTDCDASSNILGWKNLIDSCSRDIVKYYICFAATSGSPLQIIDSTLWINDTTYTHHRTSSVVGCYAVIAVDSVGNRSGYSNIVCVENVCNYILPNVFTPNGDGINDLFRPKDTYTSVENVNMVILDRWGREVFETHDPDINWEGRDMTTGQPCSDGTYFFVCDVDEFSLTGVVRRTLKGSVTILR